MLRVLVLLCMLPALAPAVLAQNQAAAVPGTEKQRAGLEAVVKAYKIR